MGQKLAVVVTGGTGKQGGAVVKSLLERGHEVRAVTRSTDSAKARELANAGVTLVRASLEDTAALTKALEGATSLFAMTTPFEGGTQAETRQGISAADAAKAAGVHLVFTSVGSANRQTGVPHFDSKYEVEEHIAKRKPAASNNHCVNRPISGHKIQRSKLADSRNLIGQCAGDRMPHVKIRGCVVPF